MVDEPLHPGAEAVKVRGWLPAHRWLLLRRATQLAILVLFLLGPLAGIWVVKGNLAASLVLDTVPLTDPHLFLQTLLAGHLPESVAITGVVIVVLFYALFGGRLFCSWVCPVNVITDSAAWLRHRLRLRGGVALSRNIRFWLLAITLLIAAVSGTIAWELVNPVSIVFRGLVFGMGLGWGMVLAIFLLDLLISRRAWCGHLCPVGAFYSLLGHKSLLRVAAAGRQDCDDCMDCFVVCPEPQVIRPALKSEPAGTGPVILSSQCTNCGRCIDVCARDVFRFDSRFHNDKTSMVTNKREVVS
jgi:ferredoxin-type protein NapH